MKAGPDIAMVASLVGDPARANMLTALMTGRALTASELAQEAGITPQTASSHLAKLEAGGLIEPEKQGRHRYYRLTGPDVAGVLEGLAGLAARAGHMRVRTGPKDPALRRARICYDHLAGDLGVQMLDSMRKQRLVRQTKQEIELTAEGERFMAKALQIDRRHAGPSAPAGVQGLPRLERAAPSSRGHAGRRHDDAVHRAEMGRARFHARQPRGQFHPQRRKAVCRAVRERRIATQRHGGFTRPSSLVMTGKTWMPAACESAEALLAGAFDEPCCSPAALFVRHLARLCSTCAVPRMPRPATREPYGIGLEGFAYPYPVSMLPLVNDGEQVRMAYMDVAPAQPNGRTVVLLHGRNFPSSYWAPVIKTLNDAGYRVVVPDQIGFGKSSKPTADLHFDTLARNTIALLDHLQIAKADIVAHSLGGMLGVRIARAYPDRDRPSGADRPDRA